MTNALTVVNDKKLPIPRKLNKGMIKALAYLISRGNYAVVACERCGIDESSYYNWLKQGVKDIEKGEETLYSRLIKSIKKASSEAEDLMVQRLREAALPGLRKTVTKTDDEGNISVEQIETGGEWLAAATFLERRHPERWGRKDRIPPTTISEDNRVVNIFVVDKDTKGLIAKVKERTGKLIEAVPEGKGEE